MNYHGAITQSLVEELLAVVHKYDKTMLASLGGDL